MNVDLRSDTVTHPTDTMREAIRCAVVGDDRYQDDPTIQELDAVAARRMGKEAGLFVHSGTMGNVVAVLAHCAHAHQALVGDCSHIALAAVRAVADSYGLAVHLDGARIFNAAVALGLPTADLACDADSVTFCLSKGLSAPAGSVLCGTRPFIQRARQIRNRLGGGLHQAGILASAGLVALAEMVDRLRQDHANARYLAEGLARLPGICVDPGTVQTNIVIFALEHPNLTAPQLVQRLRDYNVLLFALDDRQLQAVTHYGIEVAHVQTALEAFACILL